MNTVAVPVTHRRDISESIWCCRNAGSLGAVSNSVPVGEENLPELDQYIRVVLR